MPPNRFTRGPGAAPKPEPKLEVSLPPAPPRPRFTRSAPYAGKVKGLPVRPRGRQKAADERRYELDVKRFCERILEWNELNPFRMSARGWCYLLEQKGEITKGEFEKAAQLINDCRKNGLLPVDITAENERSVTYGIEQLNNTDIDTVCTGLANSLLQYPDGYTPISFWEGQTYYLEIATEKSDLVPLFQPTCRPYRIPITNFAGWVDLNTRVNMLVRMYRQWKAGRTPVLAYAGDHDPGGLIISDFLRKHLRIMARAAALILHRNYRLPAHDIYTFIQAIIIDRFGLNADFVNAAGLTWIDNLETGTGKDLADEGHLDHFKPYVQDYIAEFGERKCEANALVINPAAARELVLEAIHKYLEPTDPDEYEERLEEPRQELRDAIYDRFNVGDPPEDPDDQERDVT